jgi:hypothetical protein
MMSLSWLTNTICHDLMEVIQECGRTPRHLWLRLENQFLVNHETRTLHLDLAFHNFVHGDLSISEYYRKFKDDRIVFLNILCGLNQCFEHVGTIIRCYSSFLNFLKVWDHLLLEEIHLDTSGPAVAPTVFYSNNTLAWQDQ